jgi:hypothetical protein
VFNITKKQVQRVSLVYEGMSSASRSNGSTFANNVATASGALKTSTRQRASEAEASFQSKQIEKRCQQIVRGEQRHEPDASRTSDGGACVIDCNATTLNERQAAHNARKRRQLQRACQRVVRRQRLMRKQRRIELSVCSKQRVVGGGEYLAKHVAKFLERLRRVCFGQALCGVQRVEVVGSGGKHAINVARVVAVRRQREPDERAVQRKEIDRRHLRPLGGELRDARVEGVEDVRVARDARGARARRVLRQPIDERAHDHAHVDRRLQLRAHAEQRVERRQMKLVRKHLNQALHQILLRDRVATRDDLLEQPM